MQNWISIKVEYQSKLGFLILNSINFWLKNWLVLDLFWLNCQNLLDVIFKKFKKWLIKSKIHKIAQFSMFFVHFWFNWLDFEFFWLSNYFWSISNVSIKLWYVLINFIIRTQIPTIISVWKCQLKPDSITI